MLGIYQLIILFININISKKARKPSAGINMIAKHGVRNIKTSNEVIGIIS